MLVRMLNGSIKDLYDVSALELIRQGIAEKVILKVEDQGGPAATVGIELAMLEPKQEEHAALNYKRELPCGIGR